MTDSLDTPRPEAREAVHELDGKAYPGSRTCEHWQTVRAELLRLQSTESRAERAEAEIAALKARIADAPVATAFERTMWKVDFNQRTTYIDVPWPFTEQIGGVGQRVRLVVEE